MASNLESRRSPNFWTSQSRFLSSDRFLECEHLFIDKPMVTDPTVLSARVLGPGSKLYPSSMHCMSNKDLRERSQKLVGWGGGDGGRGLMRNYLLSETFGEPLLAALNIFRDPLLVSLKFEYETPTTNLSVLISSLYPLACENSRSSRGPSFEERGETAVFAGYVPVNSYIVDNKKRFPTFVGISSTFDQSLLLLHKRS